MDYNHDKADEFALALLRLNFETSGNGDVKTTRAWKSMPWEILDRLHDRGLISDPRNKNKSVAMTEEGVQRADELFRRLLAPPERKS